MIIQESEKIKNQSMLLYPDQFVSKSVKQSKPFIQATMDYFEGVAHSQYRQNSRYEKDYKLYNGEFDFKDYVEEPEYKEFVQYLSDVPDEDYEVPQYLRHYSIISSPINQLLGELINRPHKYKVKAVDDDAVNEVIDFRTQLIQDFFLEKLDRQIQGNPMPPEEVEARKAQIQSEILDYTSIAENWGNKVLNALKYKFALKEKSEQAWLDFLISGREFHHIYPDNSRIGFSYKVENPRNVWHIANRNAMYTDDCWAVGTLEILSMTEILNRYRLTQKEIKLLNEESLNGTPSGEYSLFSPTMPSPNDPGYQHLYGNPGNSDNTNPLFEDPLAYHTPHSHAVVTAYWDSKKAIYKRTYIDEEGYLREEFVNEDYKIDRAAGDISLEKEWVNEQWQGIKIGKSIYIKFEPVEFLQSKPIIGIVNHVRNTQGKALLGLLKPYQVMYNVAMNQLWELLDKEIGKVFLGDLKAVPNKKSADPIEQMLYEAKSNGVLFIDTSLENTGGNLSFNQFSSVDLTRTEEIKTRINIAQSLRLEAYELIGMTQPRLGNAQPSETATANNNAMVQSFAQTEPWFSAHDNVRQKVYQSLLDAAQYIELQKPSSTLNYLNSELETVFLKVSKNELLHELFVFVSSFAEDRVALKELQALAQPAMQNGAELIEVMDLFAADSTRSLRKTLQEIQDRKREEYERKLSLEEEAIKNKREIDEITLAQDMAWKREVADREDVNKQLDRINKLEVEQLKGIANEGSFSEGNTLDLLLEQTKLSQNSSKMNFEKAIKNKELELKERDLDLKEKKIDTDLKIAIKNKNKYDKKK